MSKEVPSINPKLDSMCEMLKTIHTLSERNKILEQENTLLKSRDEGFEQQIMGLLIKYEEVYKRFPDLKSAMDKAGAILKENAELKKRNGELAGQKANLERWFGEAKDLLDKVLRVVHSELHPYQMQPYLGVLKQAEQFLSEAEK